MATTLNLRFQDAGLDGTSGAIQKARLRTSFFLFDGGKMYLSSMKRNCLFSLMLIAGAALAAAPVRAHEPAKHHEKWPQASLQAEAAAEVSQDTVRITLATELSDVSQAA